MFQSGTADDSIFPRYTPCRLVNNCRHFERSYNPHLQSQAMLEHPVTVHQEKRCNITRTPESSATQGRAMCQVLRHQSLTTETWDRSRSRVRGTCGGQSGSGKDYTQSNLKVLHRLCVMAIIQSIKCVCVCMCIYIHIQSINTTSDKFNYMFRPCR
jgi:hypothetical protein